MLALVPCKWLPFFGNLRLQCDVESVQGKNKPSVFRFATLRLPAAAARAIFVLPDLRAPKDNAFLMYVSFTYFSQAILISTVRMDCAGFA